MNEYLKLVIGIFALLLAIPIGNLLAKLTKEELKSGQFIFQAIIILSAVSAMTSLFFRNDTLFFTFLFIALVASRSLVCK